MGGDAERGPTGPGPEARTTVIRVAGVTKDFHVQKVRPFLVHNLVRRLFGARHKGELLRAIDDVSFTVAAGESVALVGRNGAGKSTLLSIIVGTILPSGGTVRVDGSIGALLELGVGFHPHLTGRENVYLNASLHGLANREIDALYPAIVEFSELADFMDAPLVTYSSGMALRLGFAVAVHLDPDIIIVDEALAVGDQRFQEKCVARIREMIAAGKTLLFVSHSAATVTQFCSRAIWLERGRVVLDGTPADILAGYGAFLQSGALPA